MTFGLLKDTSQVAALRCFPLFRQGQHRIKPLNLMRLGGSLCSTPYATDPFQSALFFTGETPVPRNLATVHPFMVAQASYGGSLMVAQASRLCVCPVTLLRLRSPSPKFERKTNQHMLEFRLIELYCTT